MAKALRNDRPMLRCPVRGSIQYIKITVIDGRARCPICGARRKVTAGMFPAHDRKMKRKTI
jgi:hypothetical protein